MKIFISVTVIICLIVSLFNRDENFTRKEKTVLAVLIGMVVGMGLNLITTMFVVPFLHLETTNVVYETKQLIALKDNKEIEGHLRGGIFVTRGYIHEEMRYVVMEGNNEQGYKMKEYDPMTTYIHETDNKLPKVELTYKDYKTKLARALLIRPTSNYETHIYVPVGSICNEFEIDLE